MEIGVIVVDVIVVVLTGVIFIFSERVLVILGVVVKVIVSDIFVDCRFNLPRKTTLYIYIKKLE